MLHSDPPPYTELCQCIWERLLDCSSSLPLPHNAYLKSYVARKPVMTRFNTAEPFDVILIDEAQVSVMTMMAQVKHSVCEATYQMQSLYRNCPHAISTCATGKLCPMSSQGFRPLLVLHHHYQPATSSIAQGGCTESDVKQHTR